MIWRDGPRYYTVSEEILMYSWRPKPNGYALQTFLGTNTATIEREASTFHEKGQQWQSVCVFVGTRTLKSEGFLEKQVAYVVLPQLPFLIK